MNQTGKDIDLQQLADTLSQIAKALDDIVGNFNSAGEAINILAGNVETISALLRDYNDRYIDDGR